MDQHIFNRRGRRAKNPARRRFLAWYHIRRVAGLRDTVSDYGKGVILVIR